ncbi:MAG TPA: radical SAM protein [Phycisphaerae bacterium]|nr:radical SAM protein [Phycisphaerae bacterium]
MGRDGYSLEHVDIEVNHRCNLACRHCSARAAKGRVPEEMSVAQIRGILSQAQELGLRKVGLTGGEPLCDVAKLEEVATFCLEQLGVPIHMHTNGTLVTEEHCRPGGVLALFEAVSVTFLGATTEKHDYMTKFKGSFDRAFRGAQTCAEAGLPLSCYFIPTHGLCDGFKELAKKLQGVGVKRIRAMALAPSGRARPIYGETAPVRDELRAFERDLLTVAERLGMQVEAGNCTRLSMPGLAVLRGHEECMSGLNRVHINSKGDVFPCTAASGVRELRLGNVRENYVRLKDIWQRSPLLEKIRMLRGEGLPGCDECTQRPRCRHGCTVRNCGTMPESVRQRCPLVNGRR